MGALYLMTYTVVIYILHENGLFTQLLLTFEMLSITIFCAGCVLIITYIQHNNSFFHLVDTYHMTVWWQWQTPASHQSHAKHWWHEFLLTYPPLVVPPLLRSTAIPSIANFTFASLDISVAHWNANTGRTQWQKPVLLRVFGRSLIPTAASLRFFEYGYIPFASRRRLGQHRIPRPT